MTLTDILSLSMEQLEALLSAHRRHRAQRIAELTNAMRIAFGAEPGDYKRFILQLEREATTLL